jgi:hypothetical protein
MSAYFFDMLEGLHRWCVMGQDQAYPSQLIQVQHWLNDHLPAPLTTQAGWLQQWRTPVATWWPRPLPEDWESDWRLLSRREATLTIEALIYLDKHRPGIAAAILPPPVAPVSPPVAQASSPSVSLAAAPVPTASSPRWNMQDLVTCVTREMARRERVYPHLVHQKRLSPEEAELELSQMRSVQAYLLDKLKTGELPQQQVLF